MKNIYVIGCLFLLFTSCDSIDNKIIAEYKKQTSITDSCIINISNHVDFEWDKLYAIKYTVVNEKDLPQSINKRLADINELKDKLIFTLNDSIVYYEEHRINIEKVKKNEVIFDIPDTSVYKVYPKEKAIFRVMRIEKPIQYYYLQQIE